MSSVYSKNNRNSLVVPVLSEGTVYDALSQDADSSGFESAAENLCKRENDGLLEQTKSQSKSTGHFVVVFNKQNSRISQL